MFRKLILLIIWLVTSSSAVSLSRRIVNGTDAAPGQIPYIVSLIYADRHICGGAIIDETHILTAAHCLPDYVPVKQFSIEYGVTDITEDDEGPNVIRALAKTIHPNYTIGDGYFNDIAVMELAERIVFSDTVQPIKLPDAFEETPAGCNATLAGWGHPYSYGEVMDHLQVVDLRVYSDDECEAAHADTGNTNRLYHICAGVPEGGKGQCRGDSGGPLRCDGKVIGIVSWSIKPCAVKGFPGVFAKVSTQVPWILDNLKA